MPNLGWPELLLIAVVLLVLFGSKKLPDAARSMGRSLRIFKSETKGLLGDDDQTKDSTGAAPQQQPQQQPQAQLPPAKGDGTTLNGVPLPDADRAQKS